MQMELLFHFSQGYVLELEGRSLVLANITTAMQGIYRCHITWRTPTAEACTNLTALGRGLAANAPQKFNITGKFHIGVSRSMCLTSYFVTCKAIVQTWKLWKDNEDNFKPGNFEKTVRIILFKSQIGRFYKMLVLFHNLVLENYCIHQWSTAMYSSKIVSVLYRELINRS